MSDLVVFHLPYCSNCISSQLALQLWRDKIIDPLKERLVDVILSEIGKDRKGETAKRKEALIVATSFVLVETYKKKNNLEVRHV